MTRQEAEQDKTTAQVATRVDLDTYRRLRDLAKGEHRSVAAQARLIIETHLKEAA